MGRASIDGRLHHAASLGKMEMDLHLWKGTIKWLRNSGLVVTEKYKTEKKENFSAT